MTVKTLKGNPAGKLDSLFMALAAAKTYNNNTVKLTEKWPKIVTAPTASTTPATCPNPLPQKVLLLLLLLLLLTHGSLSLGCFVCHCITLAVKSRTEFCIAALPPLQHRLP